jgi:hypothetical protein
MQSFMIESQFLAARYPVPIIASEVAYTARLDSQLPIRMDPEEHDEWGWFTFAEAYERIKWSDDREALEQLEEQLRGSGVSQLRGDEPGDDRASAEPRETSQPRNRVTES